MLANKASSIRAAHTGRGWTADGEKGTARAAIVWLEENGFMIACASLAHRGDDTKSVVAVRVNPKSLRAGQASGGVSR